MTSEFENFRAKFKLDTLTVCSAQHWALSIRPEQVTLGSMVLSSAAGRTKFSQLGAEAGAEMGFLLGLAEKMVAEEFGSVRINALCLMMKDPIVHLHIIPRYDRAVEFNGRKWTDTDYPKPSLLKPLETDETDLENIRRAFQKYHL